MAPTQQTNITSQPATCSSDSFKMTSSSNTQSASKSTSSSYSVSKSSSKSSVSSDSSRASLEGRTWRMEWPSLNEDLIPIATRGLFYNDDFFTDARRHFDQAVKEVVGQQEQRSHELNDLDSYRKIRELDLKDSNQAVSLSEDDVCHKAVLDVKDFMDGDIKVKILDENEIMVEGTIEKKDGNSTSKRAFCRRFTFPGLVKADAVSSAMSTDGVLTVNIPKNNQKQVSNKKVNFSLQNIQEEEATNANSTDATKESLKTDRTDNMTQNNLLNNKYDILLPISEKGSFFHDSFFESARKDFEESVQAVLNKFESTHANDSQDNMTAYRSLRENNLKQESQAVSLTEDDTFHKIVLDIKDFMTGDVSVKVVDEKELKVEGKSEKNNKGESSQKSFQRSFTFPGPIKAGSITSAMSSDGILTIKVPKEKAQSQINSTKSSTSVSSFTNAEKGKSFSNIKSNNSDESLLLPVFERGNFLNDNFFESVRHDFERAVQEVMDKHGETTSLQNMTSYRSLREKDMREENQAVSVTEDHQNHKVVIDVQGFNKEDLKIRVLDENELVVEGKLEKKVGEAVSTKSFCRKFVFPGLMKSEDISSSLSSDGILIVTIPKNREDPAQYINIQSLNNENKLPVNTSRQCHQVSNHANKNISSRCILNQSNSAHSSSEKSFRNHLQGNIDENFGIVDSPFSKEMSSFHDDFFAKAHQNFENAASRVFNQSHNTTLSSEKRSFIEHLCPDTSLEDQETIFMAEDEHSIKFKIDVSEFVGGDLQVKALEQNELLVEGHKEVVDNNGRSSIKSFSRRVKLPGAVKVDAISSVLSRDGFLVVTAPKES